MKSITLYIVILFSFLNGYSQLSLSRIRANYAEVLYVLNGTVSSNVLDEIIRTHQSFGDSHISNEMILSSLISKNSTTDITNELTRNCFNKIELKKNDSIFLKTLSPITESILELPLFINFYTLFAKSYNNQSSLLQEYFDVFSFKNKYFSNMPDNENSIASCDFLDWAIQFPKEIKHFDSLYRNECKFWNNGDCNNSSLKNFKGVIETYFNENSFYRMKLPASVFQQKKNDSNVTLSIESFGTDIRLFIENSFIEILERKPTDSELNSFTEYITNNKEVTPSLVYLALLMIKNG